MTDEKRKNRKKTNGWLHGLINGPTSPGGYCAGQCFVNSQQTFFNTNLLSPVESQPAKMTQESNPFSDKIEDPDSFNFSELFPEEIVNLIVYSAKSGFLIATLITLVNEGATDYLKTLKYHPDKIFWINQGLRALLLLALGTSWEMTIALPLTIFLLHTYTGVSKSNANLVAVAIALGYTFMTNSMNWTDFSIASVTSIGFSFIGSRLTQYSYPMLRDTFFSEKKDDVANEELQKVNEDTPHLIRFG